MLYKTAKYCILIIFSILTLYQIFPFGDYCSGLVQLILMVIFGGLFLLSFLIFTVIDIIRFKRRRKKFDYIPAFILVFFLFISYIFLTSENEKFWTKLALTGQIDVGDLRSAKIKLYQNNTFSVRVSYVDFSCIYQGKYKVENDTLTLLRKDLPELTNNLFTTKYEYSYQDHLLVPVDTTFEKIKYKLGITSGLHNGGEPGVWGSLRINKLR